MDRAYLPALLAALTCSPALVHAQFAEVSQGAGYAEAVYYDLATRTATPVAHDTWDIAFGTSGRSAAIFVNEGVAASQGAPSPQTHAFASSSTDFATADTSEITAEVFNPERSWATGAFNAPATPGDQLDLGWGAYSTSDQTVQGTRIFFVALRDGTWRKLRVDDLAAGAYTFTHAALDGTDE